MDYKRAWDTLKAESGYRDTKSGSHISDVSLLELMEAMELRIRHEDKLKRTDKI
ncbi:hypothetical protein GQ472_01950 [archaeon]|nr:hypothetical protein [archaeon]